MSILNFRKQRQYTKNKSGQYDLVSNWTSAETVYDRDGHCVMERLDNALLPMVDGTDNGKLLMVKNGGWAKTQNPIIDQSKNAYTFGTRDDEDTVGDYSVVEGNNNAASGDYSHAEGGSTTASAGYSHAEGFMTIASGNPSHAEGDRTTASGDYSHAEGFGTTASGNSSHAEGTNTTASGYCSHAEGYHTEANHRSQHVFGEYNIEDDSTEESYNPGNYVEIVGNGTTGFPSNARTLDWDGNETLAGKLTTTDVIKTSTWDGTNTSLANTITALSGQYCLKVFFSNVFNDQPRWKDITYSELQTLFNQPSFNLTNYYLDSYVIDYTDSTGETVSIKLSGTTLTLNGGNSIAVSEIIESNVGTGLTVQFKRPAVHDYYMVYLIFKRIPTIYEYVES